MIAETVTLTNKLGLHARATAKLVSLATRFSSKIRLEKPPVIANAKSMLAVMQLAAQSGTKITILAEGEDEQEAVAAVRQLIENRFGEHE
jgi:phosphocarrier protein